MTTKKQLLQTTALIGIIFSLSLILGAVSDPYLSPETPLKLAPGETFIATLNLQNANPSESGDKLFVAEISGEGVEVELMENPTGRYEVAYGETAVPVKIKVTVPETMKPGEFGRVVYSFSEEKKLDTGMVTMLPATGNAFKVYVVSEEESRLYTQTTETPKTFSNLLTVIILVLVILAASICLIKKHNDNKNKKRK